MKKIIIDGENAIVGRIGSFAAKELLRGNEVVIMNAEKAIISGDKKIILDKIVKLRKKGGSSQKGPKVSKLPDFLLKRMIRGMLPWDRQKGKDAFHHLRCFVGNGPLTEAEVKTAIKLQHNIPIKYSSIKQISSLL